jgi:hypothetical protein
MSKILGFVIAGLVLGGLIGAGLFDTGPGIEPLALLIAAVGGGAGLVAGALARRGEHGGVYHLM